MHNKICVISMAHLDSKRVPKKMLQKIIGDQPLFKSGLITVQKAADLTGLHHIAAVPEKDKELIEIANSLGVETILRNEKSSNAETAEDLFDCWLAPLKLKYDYFAYVNLCLPFITTKIISNFFNKIKTAPADKSLLAVFKQRGWVWDKKHNQIIGNEDECLNTKTNEVYYIPAHCLYGYPSLLHGTKEGETNFEIFEIPQSIETTIDIDTPEDLELAKAIWKMRQLY